MAGKTLKRKSKARRTGRRSDLWRPWSLYEWTLSPRERLIKRYRRIVREGGTELSEGREILEALASRDWDQLKSLLS